MSLISCIKWLFFLSVNITLRVKYLLHFIIRFAVIVVWGPCVQFQMTEFLHPLLCLISSLHILHSPQLLLIKTYSECLQHPTPWFPLSRFCQSWGCIGFACQYMKWHKCAACMHITLNLADTLVFLVCLQTAAVRTRGLILACGENLPSAGWNEYNMHPQFCQCLSYVLGNKLLKEWNACRYI